MMTRGELVVVAEGARPAPAPTPLRKRIRRQAVVIVHGMGEQRPGDTLNRFVGVGLRPEGPGQTRFYYSRPDTVTDSFEARRFLAPRTGERPQTEFFEYHWAHLMQGNRLDDLWPTFRRMLLRPRQVPSGLKVVWSMAWVVIVVGGWAVAWGPLSGIAATGEGWFEAALRALFGGGVLAAAVSYLFARVLGRSVTRSFVDVVRYLDTSPRSYEARRAIRKGLVDLLTGLHDKTLFGEPRYQRIVVVAHSLGAYIAYDAISYLWGEMNHQRRRGDKPPLDGLPEAELAASRLPAASSQPGGKPPPAELAAYRRAQRRLWLGLGGQGNRWRVSDLVTVGTPMYFADRLYTRDRAAFDKRVRSGELPTCPPITDPVRPDPPDPETSPDSATVAEAMATPTAIPRFTWRWNRRVLHESAPFAVVRWTNLWFPHRLGLGDWFGGPLGPLYGRGIRDIEVIGNTTGRWGWLSGRRIPAIAHARYFRYPDDSADESVTSLLWEAMDLELGSFQVPSDVDLEE
jgi:hypothetical protein